MKKRIKYLFLLLFLLVGVGNGIMAQQGFGTNAPDASAVVEMKASNKGVLLPQVSLSGTNDLTTIVSPDPALLVFNVNVTTGTNSVKPGLYYWNASSWIRLLLTGDETTWFLNGNSGTDETNFVGTTAANPLIFVTNNTERMRISSDGNICIGTATDNAASPSGALLTLNSISQGFLTPRMKTAEMNSISSPATGLVVFNTDNNTFYFFKNGIAQPVFKE